MRYKICVTAVFTVVCLLSGLMPGLSQALANDISTRRKIAPGENTDRFKANDDIINFGVEALESKEVMNKAFTPLLNYIGEKIGKRFIINYFVDDKTILTQLLRGSIQIAHFSSQEYARCLIKHEPDIHYIATVCNSTKTPSDFYYGYIFTKKGRPAQTLNDLAGRTFAFVNRTSGSGYYYPLMLFRKAGIEPDSFFSRTLFLGDHPEVTAGVISETVYAGATYDGNYRNAAESCGNCLKIIEKSPPIPNEPWVAGKGVSKEIIDNIRHVLLLITPESRSSDGRPAVSTVLREGLEVDSFTVHDPSFYQVVVDMLNYTGLNSFDN